MPNFFFRNFVLLTDNYFWKPVPLNAGLMLSSIVCRTTFLLAIFRFSLKDTIMPRDCAIMNITWLVCTHIGKFYFISVLWFGNLRYKCQKSSTHVYPYVTTFQLQLHQPVNLSDIIWVFLQLQQRHFQPVKCKS